MFHRFSYRLLYIVQLCCAGVFLLGSCGNKKTYFTELSAAQTGVDFTNKVVETEQFNILTYPYLYNGTGVAIADINNDGWEDLFFTGNNKGTNRLYLNKGNFKFEDITAQAGVGGKSDWSTGVSMADINADGLPDFYISTVHLDGLRNSRNELYINKGNGRFAEEAARYGLDFQGHTTQSLFFDYDRDGDLDCFLLNHAATYNEDYADVRVRSKTDLRSGSKLLRNNGGRFEDVTTTAGLYSAPNQYGLGVSAGDLNNDGWPDFYVSNDFKENDFCYINNGNGSFTEQSESLFGHASRFSMGNDMADYNNDGWLDLLTLDMLSQDEKIIKSSVADDDMEVYDYKQHFGFHYQFSKNCLQQNNGGRHFSDVGLQAGVAATDWSWAPVLADFNNDGKKDLFVSNGYKYRTNDLDFNSFFQSALAESQKKNLNSSQWELVKKLPYGQVPDYFFTGNGTGFDDVSAAAGFTKPTLSNGTAYADLDKDGDLDLVVCHMESPSTIYRNDFSQQHYLQIVLKGEDANRFGIGASVYAYTANGLQFCYQNPVRGFMSSHSPIIHFGLGHTTVVDSLLVIWPNGRSQTLRAVSADRQIALYQKHATQTGAVRPAKKYFDDEWIDATDSSGLWFSHHEDDFNDLNVQPFLPHSLATQGPGLATADVNGDGLEDVYVCGARYQPGALLLQKADGSFNRLPEPVLAADSLCEDVDAHFFDADNDGDADLYVVSGGNEFYGRQEVLKDRLYLNDGKGSFRKTASLPDLYENKSCVRPADVDRDGDLDLFVGGRVNARMYGYTPASVLLLNDGKGNFSIAPEEQAPGLGNAGMVTDACWADLDGDGFKELLLVGEWMPVTIFKNQKGRLSRTENKSLEQSAGLWNCIVPADVDADGKEDFLLGNWGLNSKLKASPGHPLKLFIADWDQNKETDPVMAVYKNGDYYTFLGKADLEKRLPFLKKRFLKYSSMAGKSVAEIFSGEALEKANTLDAAVLQSSVLWNRKEGLTLEALPHWLQQTPLFSFAAIGKGQQNFVAAGNFYEVQPYEGRYDAGLPVHFTYFNKQFVFRGCINEPGPVRRLKFLETRQGRGLLLARNNLPLTYLKIKK